MKNDILVSVCMITYNHEQFISQAIEGVLMQKTDFPIELIIGEDCGTDKTREICIEYQQKYPEIIKLQLPDKNKGVIRNFFENMQAATGKYIALCEGDDYWTDPYKLQKQVDFLKVNEEYSACAHGNAILKEKILYFSMDREEQDKTLGDVLNENLRFQTAAVLFREKIINSSNFTSLPILSGDLLLFLHIALAGKVRVLSEEMSVYRKHQGGVSHNVTVEKLKTDFILIDSMSKLDVNFPVNALKAFLYYKIIANVSNLRLIQLFFYYLIILFYINKSEIDMSLLKQKSKKTFTDRLPRFIRRVFRKIKII